MCRGYPFPKPRNHLHTVVSIFCFNEGACIKKINYIPSSVLANFLRFSGRTSIKRAASRSNNLPLSASLATALTKLLRSEEHTSELQSRGHLVCCLLLENTE